MQKQNQKLKILCFHGFGGSAQIMQFQMRHLTKSMSKYATFYFANAPVSVSKYLVPDPDVRKLAKGQHYQWFDLKKRLESDQKETFQQSLNYISDIIQKQGPFDGMLGFCQGTGFVHLILLAIKYGLIKNQKLYCFKFGIFISTLLSRWNQIQPNLVPLDFPSLHILSKSDWLYEFTVVNTARFHGAKIMYHSEGHKIPRLFGQQLQKVIDFVKSNRKNKGFRPKL